MTVTRRIASTLFTRIDPARRAANGVLGLQHLPIHPDHKRFAIPGKDVRVNFPRPVGQSSLDLATRSLAIKRKRKDRKTAQKDDLPLMNEHLVKKIMAHSIESSPQKVMLRLVVEKDSSTQPTSEETSLADAIQTSLDLGLDLVAIDLNQKVPVVRAVKYEAKLYRANKEAKNKAKDSAATIKQFRFKARTDDHDFDRKMQGVMDALSKGHSCKLSATCPRRVVLSTNPEGAGALVARILRDVGTAGAPTSPPEINMEKTHASVLLVPAKRKRT